MILTTKGRYAVLASLYIAKYGMERSISLNEISELQNISLNYLEQIFSKLKKAGIVESFRGPGGGYKLAQEPEEIGIYSITKAVEEKIKITQCGNNKNYSCLPKNVKCLAHNLWHQLEDNIKDYMGNINLADVIASSSKEENIYLDYNATSPVKPEVQKAMNALYDNALNPSSVHFHGRKAKGLIENARLSIAKNIGIKLGRGEYDICFTSSGTEANNLLLSNFKDKVILVSKTEHLSILEPSSQNPNRILLDVNKDGMLDLDNLENILKTSPKGSLISVIFANNETGVIQDIKKICEIAHKYEMLVHSDAIQACGKIDLDIEKSGLDFASISSHKIGGPLGAAALIHRSDFHVKPQIFGGGQEQGKRPGTENVTSIVGFAKALEVKISYKEIEKLRDRLEDAVKAICLESVIFGKNAKRLPNTTLIAMPGIDAQTQLIYFDMNNISVSSGSACSSGKVKESHILKAMGYASINSAIRISLGANTKLDHIEKCISVWKELWHKNNKKVA